MFIPLYDGKPVCFIQRPYVNWALIVVTCAVYFLYQLPFGERGAEAIVAAFGVIPIVLFDQAVLPPDLDLFPAEITLVSYAFFHGSLLHLAGNMLFLWVFGDNIEDAMGHIKYLIFYLLCSISGGLAHAVFNSDSLSPLIGASGAVAGVVAAYLILHPKVKVWVLAFSRLPIKLPAFWLLGAWIIMQFVNLFLTQDEQVAWLAHIGGLAAGAVLVVVFKRRGLQLFDRNLPTKALKI